MFGVMKRGYLISICFGFNTNITEKVNLIENTAHCTNHAECPVFIEIFISVVLSQHCTNTALTLHRHCHQS